MTPPRRGDRPAVPIGGGVIVAVVVAVAALLTLRFMVADDGYPAILDLRAEMSETDLELHRMQEENRHLRRRITALRTERYPVEKMAREELDFAIPGEIIYLFPADLPAPRLKTDVSSSEEEKQP